MVCYARCLMVVQAVTTLSHYSAGEPWATSLNTTKTENIGSLQNI